MQCALVIGGLDPGGGAGVVADLRAVAFAGAFGGAVVSLQTVQSTAGLRRAFAVPASLVVAQASEVLRHQRVRAVKVGALGSLENVRAVARLLRHHDAVPLVLDTPLSPSRGKGRLLANGAVEALRELLAPRATLITVNADEAAVLAFGHGARVRTVSEAHDAARWLVTQGGARAALVKGGHLENAAAIDVLAIRDATSGTARGTGVVLELRAGRVPGAGAHGTGCTLASLVAGRLALRLHARVTDATIIQAVQWAKRAHHAALVRAADVGDGARVLAF
jgi:hydroxymethylpyrimidine/phosphomethylpyrimidine kinase